MKILYQWVTALPLVVSFYCFYIESASEQEQGTTVPLCSICYDDILPVQPVVSTLCVSQKAFGEFGLAEHTFHTPCLAQWYRSGIETNHKKCPECRAPFSIATKNILDAHLQREGVPSPSQLEKGTFFEKCIFLAGCGIAITIVLKALREIILNHKGNV
jgi:hypothetical protein